MKRGFFCLLWLFSLLNVSVFGQQYQWALYDTPKLCMNGQFNDGLTSLYHRGKYGLMNHEGKVLLEPSCESVKVCDYGLAIIESEPGSYGVMNRDGQWVLDPIYPEVEIFGGLIVVTNSEKQKGIFSATGEQILLYGNKISSIRDFSLLKIKSESEEFIYCYLTDSVYYPHFDRDLGDFYRINDSVLIDRTGREYAFDKVYTSPRGAKVVKQGNGLKLRKTDGSMQDLNNLLSTYQYGNLYDLKGDTIFKYDAVGNCTAIPAVSGRSYQYGLFTYWKDYQLNGTTYLGMSGKELLSNFDELFPVFQTPSIYAFGGKDQNGDWKYVVLESTSGRVIKTYAEVDEEFCDDLCRVKDLHGKYGYIDSKGREVIPAIYSSANPFSEGLAYVNSEKFIDTKGRVVLSGDANLSFYGGFHGTVAPVHDLLADKYGFVYNPFLPENELIEYNGMTPELAEVYKRQGDVMLAKNNVEDASQYYLWSIQCDSTNANVWNDLGVCFDKVGNTQYAIVCFEESYRLDRNETAKNNLALMNSRSQSNTNQQQSSGDSWLDILGNLGNSLVNLGNSLSGQGGAGQTGYDSYQSSFGGAETGYDPTGDTSKHDLSFYQRSYDGWARQAERCYKSMTTTGYRVKDNGQHKGGTDNHTYYVQQQKLLRNAQNKMREIRMKAQRDGYTIPKNEYEDAQVSIY